MSTDAPPLVLSELEKGELVWFDPGVGHALPGEVLEYHRPAQVLTVQAVIAGKPQVFSLTSATGVRRRQDLGQNGVEDMIQLSDLNEASLLWNLKIRYDRELIYTYVGSILVAVNPYKMYDMYGLDVVKKYEGQILGTLPPHLFAIGSAAYAALPRSSQVVVISGESGSGKTESTKLVMQYLAAVNKAPSNLITEQILEASPLLESFGNAKTVRNDNSSRFGKFLEVHFKEGVILGAKVTEYLLEKSRIVTQAPEERNYHVFYELLAGLSDETKLKYGLLAADKYFYLNQGGSCEIDGKYDAEDFQSLLSAMQVLGFSSDEQDTIFRILASVLHLGNVYFHRKQLKHGQEGVEIGSDAEIRWTGHLLQLNVDGIKQALTTKTTEARNERLFTALTIDQALDARDAFAKALYSSLFAWLVARINHIVFKGTKRTAAISILDIFGFEDFKENSFEQLCINYANENLQFYFNKHIFKLEQQEYAKEKIVWQPISYADQINIESKLKVIRFIGELVKFELYSKIEGLYCLKILLHDFSHHHIEMACTMLETCGRFFFRSADTHQRTKVYLEQMMRMKSGKTLDSRYVTMIENAYYFVNPPETPVTKVKERPVMHEFIRHILYQDVTKPAESTKVLDLMRRLNWKDPQISAYAIKCLTQAWNVPYPNIKDLANLLAGLVEYQEFVAAHVVDGVLEDIRIGLEANTKNLNQRRVAMVKYLGELYNYRMVESNDIFKHYYWFKYADPVWTEDNPFPTNINHMYRDCVSGLRPNIKFAESFQEAKENLELLTTKMKSKWDPFINSSQSGDELNPIMEAETENEANDGEEEENEGEEDDLTDNHRAGSFSDEGEESEEEKSGTQSYNAEDDNSNLKTFKIIDKDSHNALVSEDGKKDWMNDDYPDVDSDNDLSDNQNTRSHSPEDDDFLAAFDKMVSDNLQDRMRDNVKPQYVDIPVPLHVKTNTKKTYEQLQDPEVEEKGTVNFVLMLRKGNKQQYKSVAVPTNSELALNLRSQEKAERVEMEKVKRLTLDINDRLEEEDYQDQLSQTVRKNLSGKF